MLALSVQRPRPRGEEETTCNAPLQVQRTRARAHAERRERRRHSATLLIHSPPRLSSLDQHLVEDDGRVGRRQEAISRSLDVASRLVHSVKVTGLGRRRHGRDAALHGVNVRVEARRRRGLERLLELVQQSA